MDELDETVLNIQQRQKRGLIMRRYKAKIERAKELSQKRMADDKKIKKRAYAQARQIVRKRVAGKRGAEYEQLGPSEKMAIDRAIDKKAAAIKKLALRLIPKVKQAEQQRLHTFMKGQAIHNFGKPEGHHTEKASPGSAVNEELNLLFAEAFNNEQDVDQTNDANDVQMKKKKDDSAKGKSKSASIKMYNKFGEAIIVSKSVFEGLTKKSERSGVDIETLAEVYSRGRDAWVDNEKISQEQYAFARVNSYINEGSAYYELDADLHGEELSEKRGLWDNIHAKRKRIKAGSGERMRKPGSKGAPTAQDFRDAQESVEIDEAFRKWQIQQNLGKSKKEFLSPSNTVGGMNTKRIHHNEKHDIEVYHGMQVYKTTPHYVFHNDKLVHMTNSRDNAMNHAEKLGRKLDREEKKSVKEDVELQEANKYSVHKGKEGWYVNQHTDNGVWNHSVQTGYHDSKQKAVAWAKKHAAGREHTIDIKEETQIDEISQSTAKSYVSKAFKDSDVRAEKMRAQAFGNTTMTDKEHDDAFKKQMNRGRGINLALGKLGHKPMGSVRKTGVKVMAKEDADLEESNNTPYVRPHIEKGSTKQTGWKASNKHGRVKYFGMDFKKSAEKHAGISEECECDEKQSVGTKVRKKMEIVDRKPKTPDVYTKQAEVKNKIIDEEGNVQNDPKKRLMGTDSLVNAYKKDTPGQGGDINESFNIAFAAGVGVSLTAADLGMKAQGGFALHPSVIAEMEARELEEDAVSAEKKPVYMPPRRKQDGSYTAAKTVLRKSGRKIIDAKEPEDVDSDEHDGK